MEILRFTLSGKQAFFKKPDVNTYYYFTYGHVHKVALMGMFGAILGYGGYNSLNTAGGVNRPEFFERLKDIKVSLIPITSKGSFQKKIVTFNNSVGYASKEQGGNLIIKEQWLEAPQWYVYVLLDSEESRHIADNIINKRCIYIPYLGKNDHPADIADARIIEGDLIQDAEYVDSFFVKGNIKVGVEGDYMDEDSPYKYEESLPIALNNMCLYDYERFILSNMPVVECNCDVYSVMDHESTDTFLQKTGNSDGFVKQRKYNLVFN